MTSVRLVLTLDFEPELADETSRDAFLVELAKSAADLTARRTGAPTVVAKLETELLPEPKELAS